MSDPWFKFYPSDFLSGTATLSAAERGVYITLLAKMYDHSGPIERDDGRLARLCGLPKAGFVRILEGLISAGKIIIDGGGLFNSRAKSELTERENRISSARAAANARHTKTPEKSTDVSSGRIDDAGPPHSADIATRAHVPEARVQSLESLSLRSRDSDSSLRSESSSISEKTIPNLPALLPEIAVPAKLHPSEFEESFWRFYPHKVGKRDAEKAYKSARRRATREAILEGLERYKRSKPPDRAWCNPSTFLNQDRWEDRPAPPASSRADRNATKIYDSIAMFEDRYERPSDDEFIPAGLFEGVGH